MTLPAEVHLHLLLDRKTLTTPYPIFTVSGGKGAEIWLTYSEALYDKEGHEGDRNDVGNRVNYRRLGNGLDVTVTLPGKLIGTLVWRGRIWTMKPGANHIAVQ